MDCSLCYKPATVRVYGKFKNGREAQDPRCEDHRPSTMRGPVPIGPVVGREWLFLGLTARLFRMTDIDVVRQR